MDRHGDLPSIVELACGLADAVAGFIERAKRFFYEVMLWDHACPSCGGGLAMLGEGRCQCGSCRRTFDPTTAFQQCHECGGKVVVRVRRYQCQQCGADAPSRFLFDGLVFDAEYFRQKMIEHRQKKAEQHERVRQMLAESRSQALGLPGAHLEDVPGLAEALNALAADAPPGLAAWLPSEFNLALYESHIQAHIGAIPVGFDEIPPLCENRRLDRVRRFIAILFLAHAGLVDIRQDGEDIQVKKHETNGEGQGVPGATEDADGVEGPLGGAEAW
jgi:DNA-directed RNA polymerase subunit RPC12/RpoP